MEKLINLLNEFETPQSLMMFCDYERVVCVGANAYVDSLISDFETLVWFAFGVGIVVGCLLLNMFYKLKKTRKSDFYIGPK